MESRRSNLLPLCPLIFGICENLKATSVASLDRGTEVEAKYLQITRPRVPASMLLSQQLKLNDLHSDQDGNKPSRGFLIGQERLEYRVVSWAGDDQHLSNQCDQAAQLESEM
jgi:hypothetical protein